jgi:DNA-binding transcriptional MerR regulator
MSEELGYFSKYVFEQLDVTGATLRRWSQVLESFGHKFERNGQNQRIYYDKDMAILKNLRDLVVVKGVPVEVAAKAVVNTDDDRAQAPTEYADTERSDSKLDQLIEYIQRQDERLDQQERFNRELLSKLEEQHQYITESINRRDTQLLTAIREMQETKKLIAAAEEEKQQEEPKKGLFAKLFGR